MNLKVYPFHSSLKRTLETVDSPLYAMRLIRTIAFGLDISHTEVEILIGLASNKKSTAFDSVCSFIPHLSKDRVKRLINRLVKNQIITTEPSSDDNGVEYCLDPRIAVLIKDVNKESLQ